MSTDTATHDTAAPSGRPPRTMRLTTAQALVRYLAAQYSERDGVRHRVIPAMFGIFGHGNVAGLGQALQQDGDLRCYQPKNEQAAVHAAIGFAKANNRLATLACTASIGPGSTNLVTGAATATINRLPVLLLPADTYATRLQGPVLQQLEHPCDNDATVNDCLRPVSVFFTRISRPEQLLSAAPAAIRALLDPDRTGAVTLALRQDVQGEAYDYPLDFFRPYTWRVPRRPPEESDIATAAALLQQCRQPLIIAGGGVRYSAAQRELTEFSRALGVPVTETPAGKGVAEDGALVVGGIGVNGTRATNELARDADVVICVGTRLSDFTTASHSLFQHPDVEFIGINTCAADVAKLGAEPIIADARTALRALHQYLAAEGWGTSQDYRDHVHSRVQAWHRDLSADLHASQAEPRMTQGQLLSVLNDEARAGDVVIAAAGSPPGELLKLWHTPTEATMHIEFGYSCMGHEIPAGLGYRIALGDSAGEILVVIGDGTYLMANTELATAAQEHLKITVVVIVNDGYQSIHSLQRATTGTSFATEFRQRNTAGELAGDVIAVDYAANIRSLGCTALEVNDLDELRTALHQARSLAGPVGIVARVQPHRTTLGGGAWWDLGIAHTSTSAEVTAIAAADACARRTQRFYG